MWTAIYIAVIILLLYGAGSLPSRLMFAGEHSRVRYIAAPVLGFGLTVIVVQNLYWLGLPVRRQVPYLVLLMAGLFAIDLFRSRDAAPRLGGTERIVIACGMLTVLLCGWPAMYSGYKTYMAYANPDANNYQFTADRYLNYSINEPIPLDGYHPGNYFVSYSYQTHVRSGVDAYLAWVSGVCDINTKDGFPIAICALAFLIPLSVYLFVYLGLEMAGATGLVVTLAAATSSLLGLIVYQQLLGNVGGAVLLPATIGTILGCVRKVAWRLIATSALLCGALLSVYPEMFMTLAPVVGGAVIWMGLRSRSLRIIRNCLISGVAVVAGMFAFNPVWGYFGIQMMIRQAGAYAAGAGGDSYAFAFSRALLPIGFGLAPYPVASGTFGGIVFPAFRASAFALGGFCIVAVALCMLRPAKVHAGFAISGALAGVTAPALYLAFRLRYSYGFFKVFLFCEFIILAAVTATAMSVWDSKRTIGRWQIKWLGGGLMLLVILWNTASVGWYGVATLGKTNQGIVNEVSLSHDSSFDDLEQLEHVVLPGESVMVDTSSGVIQMWAVYGMRRVRVSLLEAKLYFLSWAPRGNEFTHNFDDKYVLRETAASSDIVDANKQEEPVWRSRRFQLFPFRDIVAVGANWYGLEAGSYPFRWLDTDGEILLIRPSQKRYRVSFLTSPGPGVQGNVRHISVLVNGENRFQQVVEGPSAKVVTPLLPMDHIVNRILIRIAERPALIPTDARLLNVSISKVRVENEQEVRAALAEDNPSEISARTLIRFLGGMRGVYSDTWVGPDAEILLWNRDAAERLELEGDIPPWSKFQFPVGITVKVNGAPAGTVLVKAAGKFAGSVPIPTRLRRIEQLRVSLATNHSFSGQELKLNSDSRPLSFFFSAIRATRGAEQPLKER